MGLELTNIGNLTSTNTSGGSSSVSVNTVNIINSAGWIVGLTAGSYLIGTINTIAIGAANNVNVTNSAGWIVSLTAGPYLVGSVNAIYSGSTQTVNILNSAGWLFNQINTANNTFYQINTGGNYFSSQSGTWNVQAGSLSLINSAGWIVGAQQNSSWAVNVVAGSLNIVNTAGWLVNATQNSSWNVTVSAGSINIVNSAGWTVTSKQFTDPYYNLYSKGTAQLTSSSVNFSSSGDNIIIAGQNAKTIRVYRMFLVFSSSTTCVFKDGSSAAQVALTGSMPIGQNAALMQDFSGEPWYTMTQNNAFIVNQVAANLVAGKVDYTVV